MKFYKCFLFFFFFILLVHSLPVQAQSPAVQQQAIDQQRQSENITERFLEEQRHQKEIEVLQKEPIHIKEPDKMVVTEPSPDLSCFNISEIDFKGAKILSARKQAKVKKPYLNKCLNVHHINNMVAELTNTYIEAGYITSRVFIPEQNLKAGSLHLDVIEGSIEQIKLNDDSFADRMQKFFAFPHVTGDVLYIRDLEQGIDQMNRMPSHQAKLDILPGQEKGTSVVQVKSKPKDLTRGYVGMDNLGTKASSTLRRVYRLEQDNLLKMNDQFSAAYTEDTNKNPRKKSTNYALNFSIPYGYWTSSGSMSHSEHSSVINGIANDFRYHGDVTRKNMNLDRVISRGQTHKISASSGLTVKKTRTFLEDVRLQTGSRKLSIWDAGLHYSDRYSSGFWTFNLGYEKGLRVLNAKKDDLSMALAIGTPRAQFEKYTSSLNYCHTFDPREKLLSYCLYAAGQISKYSLYNTEQLSIGDPFTVRGFRETSAFGDSGGYMRHELSLSFPYQRHIQNSFVRNVLGNVQLFMGYDAGIVRKEGGKNVHGPSGKVYLAGRSFGIRNAGKYLNASLTVSHPIRMPQFMETTEKKDTEIYFTVTLKIF